jgi:hypothetical protein
MRREERAQHPEPPRAVPLHGREQRAELARGEIFQGAKTSVEFGRGQAPLVRQRMRRKSGAGRSPLRVLHSMQQGTRLR